MSRSLQHIDEPARQTPVFGEFEVVVLGGGPAGLAAASTAARLGRKTLLVERYGFLGGMGTAAGVTNFCGLFANIHGEITRVVHGFADGFLERIDKLGGLNAPHLILGKTNGQAYDTSAYKIAADEMLEAAGADVLFHALGAGIAMRGGRIDALFVETKSGRLAIRAEIFIDASGDGDLAAWAGAPFEIGNGPGAMHYPTTMFRLNGVDAKAAGPAWSTIPEQMKAAEAAGRYRFPRHGAIIRPQRNPAEWRVNVTQLKNVDGTAINGIDAEQLSRGEIDGRRQAADFLAFLRAEAPGFGSAYIVDIAPQIGIRETRRILGRYVLTADDVLKCADFPDAIGVNGWPLEQHVAGDIAWAWPDIPGSRGYNQLPYRMMLPKDVANLLVAGRCASMTHDGQSAARVSGACFVMGQAAGTAAHLALAAHRAVADIDTVKLQQQLLYDGAFLGA